MVDVDYLGLTRRNADNFGRANQRLGSAEESRLCQSCCAMDSRVGKVVVPWTLESANLHSLMGLRLAIGSSSHYMKPDMVHYSSEVWMSQLCEMRCIVIVRLTN